MSFLIHLLLENKHPPSTPDLFATMFS